jgi:hypothetical protein
VNQQSASVAGGFTGMLNVFVDPASTVKQIPSKLFWVWPVAIVSIARMVVGYLMLPYATQLVDARMAQQNVPADRLESATRMTHLISQISIAATPVFVIASSRCFPHSYWCLALSWECAQASAMYFR